MLFVFNEAELRSDGTYCVMMCLQAPVLFLLTHQAAIPCTPGSQLSSHPVLKGDNCRQKEIKNLAIIYP